MKKFLSLVLVLALMVSFAAPAFAHDTEAIDPTLQLTAVEEAFLDLIDYDNVVAMAYYMTHNIGVSVTASPAKDLMVEYMVGLFESWGYEPELIVYDLREPTVFAGPQPNRRWNNGHIEIGGQQISLFGPAYAATSVYTINQHITVHATGTAVLHWPSTGINNQTFAALEIPDDADFSGRVVFVTMGTGPTQNQIAAVHPTAALYHNAAVALEAAGAAAVVFRYREPRSSVISQLPPFNGEMTVGETTYARIPNVATGTPVTIPVGTVHYWEANDMIESLGTGDNTPVLVDMQTRWDATNVRAVWPSATGSTRNVYITSHFDTVFSAPGFNDSKIGVAMAMEIARIVAEYNLQFEYNLVFLMFDAEENGLLGARYYVSHMTDADKDNFVGLYNMDMIATSQPEAAYMFMNISNVALREIQRNIGINDRLILVPEAFEIASQFDVFNHTFLAVQKLDNAGRHLDRQLIVDPTHPGYGPFIIQDHFNITWGSTTDQWAFVHPQYGTVPATLPAGWQPTPLPGHWPENMRNSMQFDWRLGQRGFFPPLSFAGMLELLYHRAGDTYYDNFNRCRLMVVGDVVALALLHSARFIGSDILMATDAHLVRAGEYFEIDTMFVDERESNVVVLSYTFDGDLFRYAGFTPADGVGLVLAEHGEGYANITLMIPDYDAQELGSVMLQARDDAELVREWHRVNLSAEFVERDAYGEKSIMEAATAISFTTRGTGNEDNMLPEVVDLIFLSNMIDWFGTDRNHPNWYTFYVFFDFNNNGSIDIYDIVHVARMISTAQPLSVEIDDLDEEYEEEEDVA